MTPGMHKNSGLSLNKPMYNVRRAEASVTAKVQFVSHGIDAVLFSLLCASVVSRDTKRKSSFKVPQQLSLFIDSSLYIMYKNVEKHYQRDRW